MEKSIDDVLLGWACCSLKGNGRYCKQCPYQLKNEKDIYKCSMELAKDMNGLIYEKRISLYAVPGGDTIAFKTKEES